MLLCFLVMDKSSFRCLMFRPWYCLYCPYHCFYAW